MQISPLAASTEEDYSSVNLNLHLVKSEHGGQYNTRFTTAMDTGDVASGDNEENILKPSHFISFIIKVETHNRTYFTWQVYKVAYNTGYHYMILNTLFAVHNR